jgi:HD-GYP domain-containing protein (c-di-GMP phosphodiesterase class II)
MTRNILDTVATHHERHLGHGYPHGLSGQQIPVFGRIAAIVDCYDAITSDRPYAKALSQYDSIRKLYEWRDHDFQADMVEQFIQCLGVYPTGSLVELSTGQVGIVLMQNPVRRLKPTLMLVLDENKIAYDFQPRLDLTQEGRGVSDGSVEILRALEPGSYGINPGDYYI